MAFIIIAAATVLVLAIAFVAIGSEVGRGEAQPSIAVLDLVDATNEIAEHLSESITASLSYDELECVVGWYADYFEEIDRGGGTDAEVVTDDHLLAFVLLRSSQSDLSLADREIGEIVNAIDEYLRRIGAIGPVADLPDS